MNTTGRKVWRVAGLLVFLSALWMSTAAPTLLAGNNTLVFPQSVTGGDFTTTITIINTNFSQAVNGVLSFFNSDGTPKTVTINGLGSNNAFNVAVPAGGTAVLTTASGGTLSVGMAKFVSDFPAGGVIQFQNSSGQVGVLDSPSLHYASIPLNTANGNDTGIAIANAGGVPVNLMLVYADGNGSIIESVRPPELNPLPVNGQDAKFVSQFGFTHTANQSSGSIRIQTGDVADTGSFNALALLLKGPALASTATVVGVTGENSLEQFAGSYTGHWNNTTFSTSGDAFASMAGVASTQVAFFQLTLTGPVFGGSNPPPTTLAGTFSSGAVNLSGNSDLFGPVTLTIAPDGTMTFTANSVPGPLVATFTINGMAHPDKITGNYTITFKAGGNPANGTLVLNHTNQ
ncbi:MAG: hypothetical protein PHX83_15130 [Acidobacteriia bacterium]|nr:hypothetical protein [Terriglobia bacterium]